MRNFTTRLYWGRTGVLALGHDKCAMNFTSWAGNVIEGKIDERWCSSAGTGWSSRNKWPRGNQVIVYRYEN